MTPFSGMDAAFEGFRITRAHPLAVLAWAVILFIVSVIGSYAMQAMAGDALRDYMRIVESGGQPTPEQMGAFFSAMGPVYLILILLAAPANALIFNAAMRASDSDRGDTLVFLRVGMAEGVQTVNLFLWGLVMFAAYIAVVIVGAIPGGLLAVGLSFIHPMLSALGVIVAVVVAVLGLLLVAGRFALAGPVTLDRGGIGLGGSWTLTKGLSWSMVGALFIAGVFALIVVILVGLIDLAILSTLAGGWADAWSFVSQAGVEESLFTSAIGWVHLVFSALSNTLVSVILFGVGISAYRQLKGRSGTTVPTTA